MIRRLALLAALGLTAAVTPSANAIPFPLVARYCQQQTVWFFDPLPTLLPIGGTVTITRAPATCFDVSASPLGITPAADSTTTLTLNYFGTCAAMLLSDAALFNPGGALEGVVAETENVPGIGYTSRTDLFLFGSSPCLGNDIQATWHKVYVY